jgi:hypothetical protein
MEPGPLGRPRRLNSIVAHYMNRPKPELDFHPPVIRRIRQKKKSLRERLRWTSKAREVPAGGREEPASASATGRVPEDPASEPATGRAPLGDG